MECFVSCRRMALPNLIHKDWCVVQGFNPTEQESKLISPDNDFSVAFERFRCCFCKAKKEKKTEFEYCNLHNYHSANYFLTYQKRLKKKQQPCASGLKSLEDSNGFPSGISL